MSWGEDAPPMPQSNPGKDLNKFVDGLLLALPKVVGAEGQYRSTFGGLNLADTSNALNGTGGQVGLIGQGAAANTAAQGQINTARTADIAGQTGNAGAVNNLLGAISPGRAMSQQATQLASDAYTRASGPLSFQEKRGADQQAREAFAARGRLGDNASIVSEALSREDVQAAKREEAMKLGTSANQMEQQWAEKGLNLLGGAPVSLAIGQDYLNMGRATVGQNVPQLVDTGAGIQLGAQNASNLSSWYSNAVAAKNKAEQAHASFDMAGIAATLQSLASLSDKRAKTNVKKVGKTDSGQPIYTYNLLGSPKTEMGVMAQEVKKKQPKALGPIVGGLMTVDYSKIK